MKPQSRKFVNVLDIFKARKLRNQHWLSTNPMATMSTGQLHFWPETEVRWIEKASKEN